VIPHDDYEGRIAPAETVEVRARVLGHLAKIGFKDGQIVNKGDLLYEIDPRPYQASLDAAKAQEKAAQANLQFAKAEYNRTRSLVARNAASREELDVWTGKQAVAEADVLKTAEAVKRAELDLEYTKVTAPMSGKISRTQVDVGNLVNAGGGETLLTTLVSVNPMYVYFDVDERSLLRYREIGQKQAKPDELQRPLKDLHIPVYVALEGEQGYPHKGELDFADNRVNPSTGTIQVRGELPNARRDLDAGMRARVRIPVGAPQKSLLITERAVGTDQGRRFVYIVNDKNVAERRDVKLGRLSDGLQIVEEGVKPEDWIVVNGIQRVRDGAKVEPNRTPMPGAASEPTNQAPKN
jgi:RND family efflux transporter MFP subunit